MNFFVKKILFSKNMQHEYQIPRHLRKHVLNLLEE